MTMDAPETRHMQQQDVTPPYYVTHSGATSRIVRSCILRNAAPLCDVTRRHGAVLCHTLSTFSHPLSSQTHKRMRGRQERKKRLLQSLL